MARINPVGPAAGWAESILSDQPPYGANQSCRYDSPLILKDLLDPHPEYPRNLECQRQARIELAFLDGVRGLARHVEFRGKPGLRPVAFGAQHLEAVLHAYRLCPTITPTR